MPNPYGWGQNEPQIKPKDQGGDTIATFCQKIYNLFDNLFDTLNSYPWSTATQSDAGYMSADDKKAVDGIANLGTFNKMFFSQTSGSYTAPRTGVYRITLKGGGGGGGGCSPSGIPGNGGSEGGSITFFTSLTASTSYAYTIGAGGAGGAVGVDGGEGGNSVMIIDGVNYVGGQGHAGSSGEGFWSNVGGTGSPILATTFMRKGAPGATGAGISAGVTQFAVAGAGGGSGGGGVHSTSPGMDGEYGGGGAGGGYYAGVSYAGGAGGAGYILIEYAG